MSNRADLQSSIRCWCCADTDRLLKLAGLGSPADVFSGRQRNPRERIAPSE